MNDRYAKMKAAFEKQQSNRGMSAIYEGDGHYRHPATQREWENWQDAWQAATETAKPSAQDSAPAELPQQSIKTWQERAAALPLDQRHDERTFMREEIAELRAALTATPASPQPVAKVLTDVIGRAIRFIESGSHTIIARDTMVDELKEILTASTPTTLTEPANG